MEEYLEIRLLLINGSIDYKEAFERIKKLPKAWTTKHWKELREKHLKDKCENCGSSEQPLVIQHTKHPAAFSNHYDKLMSNYVDYEMIKNEAVKKYSNKSVIDKYLKTNSIVKDSCPICGIITVRKNMRLNLYTCQKNHTFDKPLRATYYTKTRTTDIEKARSSAISYLTYLEVSKTIKELRETHDLEVGKAALLLSFEEGMEYRLFKNIKTCCKRCAAIEDDVVPEYVLCKKCNTAYHNPIYQSCFNCKDN